jgi:hypothetical protein
LAVVCPVWPQAGSVSRNKSANWRICLISQ